MNTSEIKPLDVARKIVDTLEDKKGEDIVLMDLRNMAPFADYFVLCNGTSDRMLTALADAVQETAKKEFGMNTQVEGEPVDGWMLVDLGDVIVHLFSPDQREYYGLEELWERAKVLLRLQ